MREIKLLARREHRLEDDVQDALHFLLRNGVASTRSPNHSDALLVLDAYWHRAFQLLVAENFDVI
jgi:hypothetical protein